MNITQSNRIIATPSSFARENLLYVQEVGSLQSLSPHISRRDHLDSFLFFIVTKGSGQISYHDQNVRIQAGDCIFLSCQEEYAHESSSEDPWDLSWVHFYGTNAQSLYNHYCDQNGHFLFHPQNPTPFLDTLKELFIVQSSSNSMKEILSHRYLTDLIALTFTEINQTESNSIKIKIHNIQLWIDTHFSEKISLEKLSEDNYISKYHLAREFKKNTGSTIGNYITSKRISHAKKQLRFTDLPLEDIAQECGLSDTSYFVKVFKNAEGITPGEYRKKW